MPPPSLNQNSQVNLPTQSEITPPVFTSSTPDSSHQPKRKWLKKILLVFVVAIILILFTVSVSLALAYYNYPFFKPPAAIRNQIDKLVLTLPFLKSSSPTISQTIAKTKSLKSVSLKYSILTSPLLSDDQAPGASGHKIEFAGPLELGQSTSQYSQIEFNLSSGYPQNPTKALSVSYILDNNGLIFAKINEISNSVLGNIEPPTTSQGEIDISQLKGKWYSLNLNELPQVNSSRKQPTEKFKAVYTALMETLDQLSSSEMVTVSEKDVVSTLKITPPRAEWPAILDNLTHKSELGPFHKVEESLFAKILLNPDDLIIKAEIGQNDYLLRKFNLILTYKTIPDSLFSLFASPIPNNNINLPIAKNTGFKAEITYEFSEYNKPIAITPPSNSLDFAMWF